MKDLIERQTVIESIRECAEAAHDNHEWDMEQGYWNAIECIEEEPSAQPEQRWISCSERLPDEDYWTGANFQYSADVLMTVYNAEDEDTIIDYGHTVDGSWYSDTTDCFVPSWWEVLAWMPLPEPYKKGEEHEVDTVQ